MQAADIEFYVPEELIMNQIYYIREQKVMLDKDLAKLYQVETRNLNKAVSRNLARFPGDFMFQLTQNEFDILKFQIGTSSSGGWGGTRKLPYVFTEQGVAMISGILKSERAVAVNIQIMRVFTHVRKMLFDNTELRLAIEEIRRKTDNHTKNIELVFQYLDELIDSKEAPPSPVAHDKPPIGFRFSREASGENP
jgi:hypothetical protein